MDLERVRQYLSILLLPEKALEKPIFLVGCGKSGTTMLGLMFSFHPAIGPQNSHFDKFESPQEFLDNVLKAEVHGKVAHEMEEKPLWDRYFPTQGVDLRIGKELIVYSNPLGRVKTAMLRKEMTENFQELRFFSKQPFNTFRIHVLRELFPDAKILAIHRDGRDVVSSWGKEVNRWDKLGGFEKGIPIFARKWNEAVSHIEEHKDELEIFTVRYEDIIENPQRSLKQIFDFCELEFSDAIYNDLRLANQCGKWKERIPEDFHPELNRLTRENLQRLGYAD